ncbi:F-box/LRR-repeat protein At3g26922-like [Salvia miltiorrhiza]|uniref:F-box/LRR-repeat protein At3g26922-like n=1 Tax=Salvia miltiorrhiza TaxID=226208 RepID=UPI0025ABB5C9|nr:F-box/LRR-repeat protein At3g26922-like [Salvia miltiorrhiza]XP_057775736.1 F-box/LRR-repeat protein At3g26922-like [Salvia miltiorrhiza]
MDSWHHPDRLSELPDSLILMILSLLETRYVVRTTLLSKRWRDLWTTVPRLKFVRDDRRFICGVLAQWRGEKIISFYLSLVFSTPSDLDLWLLFAVERQVEELHIDFGPYSNAQYYPPQRLYPCSSITELHLGSCCLLEIEGSVQWNRLKSLWIEVPDSSCDDAIKKILLGAPRLEKMILFIGKINENLSIRSTSLKKLIIRSHWNENADIMAMLRIWAPNLLTLRIWRANVVNGGSCLFDVPSLIEASISGFCDVYDPPLETFYHVIGSICHVKKVELSEFNIKSLLAMKGKDMVVQFPNAELLKHQSVDANGHLDLLHLLDLLDMFPKLKILSICQYQILRDFSPTVEATLPRPSLLDLNTVEIIWPAEDPSVIPFIEFILQTAPLLHKLVFRLSPFRASCNRKRFRMIEEKMRSMPRSSPTAEVTIIYND